jgi:hypothetical protein
MSSSPRGGAPRITDAERYALGEQDHAALAISLVVLDRDDPDREPDETVMIPMDEVESGLQPDQITNLRTLRSFGVITRESGLQIAIHATVRRVIVRAGAEFLPQSRSSMGPREATAVLSRQQRRRLAREQGRASQKVGLVLEVAVGAGIPSDEGTHVYSFDLTEMEAKLPAEHVAALRLLQPVTVAKESGDVWVTLSLSRARPGENAGDDPARLRLVH